MPRTEGEEAKELGAQSRTSSQAEGTEGEEEEEENEVGDFLHDEPEDEEDEGSEEDSEEEDDYNFEDDESEEDKSSEKASVASKTLTSVSNETDPSLGFLDAEELERQAALEFAGPPWAGWMRSPVKALAACMLPFVLAALLIYGFVKFWGIVFQCVFDVLNLAMSIAWLAVRVALSPLYLCWMAFVPTYIRMYCAQAYEENLANHVRSVIKLIHLFEDVVTHFPQYTAACYVAAFETFVEPARVRCYACLYRLFGMRAEELVLQPWHDKEINRGAKRRRARLEHKQLSDPAYREAMKKLEPKRAKIKAARRARARRLKLGKRAHEITLMLPINDKARQHHLLEHGDDQVVTIPHRLRSQMVSRVMVIERRYAIAAGFVWCMIGAVILIVTLDGAEGERCLICAERPDVGLRVCRHGQDQDCAFELHMREIVIAITIIGVGAVLMVYAIFLYKPDKRAAKVTKAEHGKKRQDTALRRTAVKDMDLELATVQYLLERLNQPGFNRRWRRRYYRLHHLPCVICLVRCAEALLGRLFIFEERHRLRERSVALQDALFFMAIGWFQALLRFLGILPAKEHADDEADKAHRSRCGKYLRRCLNRIPCLRPRSSSTATDVARATSSHTRSRRPKLLEEVLERFGLTPAGDAAVGDLEAGHRRLSFGRGGSEETQREFGLEEVDAAVPEEELHFQGESDDDAKQSVSEDEDEEIAGWNTDDENAAEPLELEWGESAVDSPAGRDHGGEPDEVSERSSAESGAREPVSRRSSSSTPHSMASSRSNAS